MGMGCMGGIGCGLEGNGIDAFGGGGGMGMGTVGDGGNVVGGLDDRISRPAGGASADIRDDMPKLALFRLMRTGCAGSVSGWKVSPA